MPGGGGAHHMWWLVEAVVCAAVVPTSRKETPRGRPGAGRGQARLRREGRQGEGRDWQGGVKEGRVRASGKGKGGIDDAETVLVRRYIPSCECKTSRPRSSLVFRAPRGVAATGGERKEGRQRGGMVMVEIEGRDGRVREQAFSLHFSLAPVAHTHTVNKLSVTSTSGTPTPPLPHPLVHQALASIVLTKIPFPARSAAARSGDFIM